jgi:hypothetical protein
MDVCQLRNFLAVVDCGSMQKAAQVLYVSQWLERLAEPATLGQQRDFGATVAASWPDPEGSCQYGTFDQAGGAVVGAVRLHDHVGPGALGSATGAT